MRPFERIAWKIILPYAFLVLVLASVGTYLTTELVTGSLDERFRNQLLEASRAGGDSVGRLESSQLETLRSVTFTEGLADAVRRGDSEAVRRLVEGIAVNSGVERLEVLAASGHRVLGLSLVDPERRVYEEIGAGDEPAAWPLTSTVLDAERDALGDKHAQIVETEDGFFFFTAGPIEHEGKTAGAVLIGQSLGSVVRRMKSEALADITVYDFRGRALASTFVAEPGQADLQMSSAAGEGSAGDRGGVVREERELWGRRYDLVYSDLIIRNEKVGLFSAALPSEFIFEAAGATRWQMALLFGLGMAAVLAVGFFIAQSMTRPIAGLAATAERVSSGDLTARTDVHTHDELGRLAVSLNQMTDRLEGQYMATLRALASAVAGSNPYTVRHSLNVGELAMMLGRRLELDERSIAQLEIGGYLHDVGRVGIRDSALLNSGQVPAEHRRLLQDHPHIGVTVQEAEHVRRPVMEFVAAGLPRSRDGDSFGGLGAEQLVVISRIVAVADMYDALTSDRPEGVAMTAEEALDVMRRHAGGVLHFGTVEKLAAILPEWERSRGRGSDIKETRRSAEGTAEDDGR